MFLVTLLTRSGLDRISPPPFEDKCSFIFFLLMLYIMMRFSLSCEDHCWQMTAPFAYRLICSWLKYTSQPDIIHIYTVHTLQCLLLKGTVLILTSQRFNTPLCAWSQKPYDRSPPGELACAVLAWVMSTCPQFTVKIALLLPYFEQNCMKNDPGVCRSPLRLQLLDVTSFAEDEEFAT